MGAVVAVVNQKGGVGKTTITLGLASAAQARGDRVLVVDADPQANATWALGVDPDTVKFGTSEAIAANRHGASLKGITSSTWGREVDVLPASGALQERETEDGKKKLARRLRIAIEGVADDYELVLIDCSPALGPLTTNALSAAHLALMVVEPAALSARGIAGVSDLIDGVWERFNKRLDIAGVIVNRVPPVSHEAQRQHELLVRMLGKSAVWEPQIPQRVVVTEALGNQLPVHAMGSRGADIAAMFDTHYAKLRRLGRKSIATAAVETPDSDE
jgi:chromosome partitioning protein